LCLDVCGASPAECVDFCENSMQCSSNCAYFVYIIVNVNKEKKIGLPLWVTAVSTAVCSVANRDFEPERIEAIVEQL